MRSILQESVLTVRQVPTDLLHPRGVGIGRDACDLDMSRLEMHDGEDVERDQSPARPDFDRCEVCGEDGIPVSLQERGPCCCPLTVGCWLNAMCLQDVGHCGIGDVISDVLKCSLNAIVAPRRILPGEANDGIHDFLTDAWSTRLAFVAGAELLRDQFAMPSQNRAGRDDGGQFQQSFAADGVSLYSQ